MLAGRACFATALQNRACSTWPVFAVSAVQVASGVKVIVQPSKNRIFPNLAYVEAGAVLQEDLSEACVILAVKEVPIPLLLPSRTYCFFSHTKKAQPANMPLLDALLEKNIRMVDYESITEGGLRNSKRLVAFGRFAGTQCLKNACVADCVRICCIFAGIAGMIDFLRGLGERFLSLGYSTPFLEIGSTYMYSDLEAARDAVRYVGL